MLHICTHVYIYILFCQRFLPVKRESFLSTVASGMLRTGDWTEDKFQCNLLVSLARVLFLNWLYMNYGLDYDCNELNSNWLELGNII